MAVLVAPAVLAVTIAGAALLPLERGGGAVAQELVKPSDEERGESSGNRGWLGPYIDLFSGLRAGKAEGDSCRSGDCGLGLECCCCGGVCRCKRECSFKPCR